MFPIIPYNLNHSSRMLSYPGVYSSCSKSSKVVASCDIPSDTISDPINLSLLCGKLENCNEQLEVGLNSEKVLSLTTTNVSLTDIHWIQSVRLADDCHGYNAKLCLQKPADETQNSYLVIQITRPIESGHELLLWFSEDILANLQMAFLSPANIQGQKKYVCHICSTTFEYPNPLKIHLTLDCSRQQVSILWERLVKSINSIKNETLTSKTLFGFQLIDPPKLKEKYSILNLSKSADVLRISSNESPMHSSFHLSSLHVSPLKLQPLMDLPYTSKSISPSFEVQRPLSEPGMHSSAFKPYPGTKKLSQNNNSIRLTQSVSNLSPNFTTTSGLISQNYSTPLDINHAAQMETLVSNLGKSKQGHLCIYCGKCYSRKYGLKIHIRTHTGYKPLKCKFCLRPFGDPSNLNKHVRLHAEGETPYKCELCGKVLVRRRDLERHLRSRHMGNMHLGEKIDDTINSSSDHSDD